VLDSVQNRVSHAHSPTAVAMICSSTQYYTRTVLDASRGAKLPRPKQPGRDLPIAQSSCPKPGSKNVSDYNSRQVIAESGSVGLGVILLLLARLVHPPGNIVSKLRVFSRSIRT
jgi:hypothetical protein